MRFPTRTSAPSDVVARAGEKVLAAAATDGAWLLGTRTALLVVDDEVVRIPWEQVELAGWDSDERVLALAEVGEWGRPQPQHRWTVAEEPERLLMLVRERVTASVVLQRRDPHGFTVNARRPPAGGDVTWSVTYDDGVAPDDPHTRALVDDAVATARGELI